MSNKKMVYLSLVFLTGMVMLFADFLLLVFFDHSHHSLLFRLGIPGLAFLGVYFVVLGRKAQCFAADFFKGVSDDEFLQRIKQIGAVPIKMIALNVLLHLVFLGSIFFNGAYLGTEPDIRGALFLAALSFGMLVGTFIYVMSDGLVSQTLIAHGFTRYPRELRENRQGLKAFIIPLAVALMAVLFTCSITLLGLRESDNHVSVAIIAPLGIFFLCITALAFRLKKNSSLLYTSVIEQLENLSSERKDLTRRITVCSVDELGTIAGMVNAFCEHLGGGIKDIKGGQKELSAVGNRLEGNASSMVDSITQISGAAEQVMSKTRGQIESVNTSSQAVRQISNHIKALDDSIAAQTSSMSQASAAVEEMVGNISSIGAVTEKMAVQFETVGDAATEGSRVQKENSERVREIVAQSETLQETNQIIATIAAQTNLLAMNAAIEAAHAGEAGRGFSVVADEIRKLAENSSSESQKIRTELKQIVQTIDRIVKDSAASEQAFAEVSHRVNETGKLVAEVNNAIREQRTGAGQVMDSLRSMNELTTKVRDGSREMNQGSESMLQEIGALQNSAGEIAARVEEMSGSIKNINTGAQEVSNLAATAHSSIEKISDIANGFEV